jgi:hypothetical protein
MGERAMKRIAVLVGAACLSACGITGKLDAVSSMEASGASYRSCMVDHSSDSTTCEAQRVRYQADLAEAGKMRGVLTDWRWL